MSTSNAGASVVLGDVSLRTGAATVGRGGRVSLGSGLSANKSGVSITISVDSGDGSGGMFSVSSRDSSGEPGGISLKNAMQSDRVPQFHLEPESSVGQNFRIFTMHRPF